ncbi:hypothetical protein HanPSC8_Chr08g0329821 [Helianthus annuus]|nr:hypothetical protein HanPSC8_Chr08g0329821 [Helianthus annuus]
MASLVEDPNSCGLKHTNFNTVFVEDQNSCGKQTNKKNPTSN